MAHTAQADSAYRPGLRVSVVSDGTLGLERPTADALAFMKRYYGARVATASAIVAGWEAVRESATGPAEPVLRDEVSPVAPGPVERDLLERFTRAARDELAIANPLPYRRSTGFGALSVFRGPAVKSTTRHAEIAGCGTLLPLGDAVASQPRVLVIDDGELSRIRGFLDGFGVELEHLRGRIIREDLEGSFDLVIATVKQTLEFEDSVDLETLPGKPVWIAVHAQDFLPLRVRLKRMGVQYLVQSSVGSEALRLLLVHSLYQGSDRRDGMRLPVGTPVSCRSEAGEGFRVDLLDLNREGCRLLTDRALELGSGITLDLPAKLAGGEKLELTGRVSRVEPHPGTPRMRATLEFHDLADEHAALLEDILQGKIIGTVVTRLGEELSEETAPTTIPVSIQERSPSESESGLELASAPEEQPEYPFKRLNLRTPYSREVTVLLGGRDFVILGRDLSIAGMRAEPIPELPIGTELELAIYGAAGAEPVLVKAVVARDDGEFGTVFHFTEMAEWERPRLEAIVNAGAEIESLSAGAAGDRIVVTHARERVTSLPRRR